LAFAKREGLTFLDFLLGCTSAFLGFLRGPTLAFVGFPPDLIEFAAPWLRCGADSPTLRPRALSARGVGI